MPYRKLSKSSKSRTPSAPKRTKPAFHWADLNLGWEPSSQQIELWKAMLTGDSHILGEARAGTGKTSTTVAGLLLCPESWTLGAVAFNRPIANELQSRLPPRITASTQHSLGYAALRQRYTLRMVESNKSTGAVERILDNLLNDDRGGKLWQLRAIVCRLVSLAKANLVSPFSPPPEHQPPFEERMRELAERHGIDTENSQRAFDLAQSVLLTQTRDFENEREVTIDFDDMIWGAVITGIPLPQFDLLVVDEAQDLNPVQQELAIRCVRNGRLAPIGDRYQSIYGFRGADTQAIPNLIKRLSATKRGCQTFPLTITRRCPRLHVEAAKCIVEDFEAAPNCPDGSIDWCGTDKFLTEAVPGNLAICRVNAPLCGLAYQLLRRGVRATILGRDIGGNLLGLWSRLQGDTIHAKLASLDAYEDDEGRRIRARKSRNVEALLTALADKCDCLTALTNDLNTVADVSRRIETLFQDMEKGDSRLKNSVVLSSIHKGKGLESERVFVIQPQKLPLPVKQAWETEQELHLLYVALTRSKSQLSLTGGGLPKHAAVSSVLSKSLTPKELSNVEAQDDQPQAQVPGQVEAQVEAQA